MFEKAQFLDLPSRATKPRDEGLTHVLDRGMTLHAFEGLLAKAADHIDFIKLGWGIGYIDEDLRDKVLLCKQAHVTLCLGGTLIEVTQRQGRIAELSAWAQRAGVEAVEVSNGLEVMSMAEKQELIRQLSGDFLVLAETGAKDQNAEVYSPHWVEEMEADIAVGAALVIAEGRESGTVGLYNADGSPRTDLVDAIAARIPLARVIFEAPTKAQQSWFIKRLGPDVGLGNIAADEVVALETLRLGLRADTALTVLPASVSS